MTTTTDTLQYATTRPEARRLPWNVMGDALRTNHTDATAALMEHGLDYDTRMVEFTVPGTDGPLEAPKHRAVVRPRPGGLGEMVVGVTGTRFTPIQNRDAFSVATIMGLEFGATITGCADFRSGGATIMAVDLARPVVLNRPDGGTDTVDLNLLIKNAHDGSAALTFALTPIRVECTNAVQAAIAGAKRVWKISHTPNAQERVNLAHQSILSALTYQDAFQAKAQAMIDQEMTDAEFAKIVANLWPVKDGAEETKAGKNRLEVRSQVLETYHASQTLEGVRGTLWGGYNAITEWYDWSRPARGGDVARAEGALEGAYVRAKASVWDRFAAAVA